MFSQLNQFEARFRFKVKRIISRELLWHEAGKLIHFIHFKIVSNFNNNLSSMCCAFFILFLSGNFNFLPLRSHKMLIETGIKSNTPLICHIILSTHQPSHAWLISSGVKVGYAFLLYGSVMALRIVWMTVTKETFV